MYKSVHSIACGQVTAAVTGRPINQETYKAALQGTSTSRGQGICTSSYLAAPSGQDAHSNTAKEAQAKLRGNPNSNTVSYFITESESI